MILRAESLIGGVKQLFGNSMIFRCDMKSKLFISQHRKGEGETMKYKRTAASITDLLKTICIELPIVEIGIFLIDLLVFGILQLIFGWSRGFTEFMIALPMIIYAIYIIGCEVYCIYLSKKTDEISDELDRKNGTDI